MNNKRLIDYLFFIEAWCLLHLSKLVIIFMPFRKIASWMGSLQVESSHDLLSMGMAIKIEHALGRGLIELLIGPLEQPHQAIPSRGFLVAQAIPEVRAKLGFGLRRHHPVQPGILRNLGVAANNLNLIAVLKRVA